MITRSQRKRMNAQHAKLPRHLQEIPKSQWPSQDGKQNRVWMSRDFLVQEFIENSPVVARLSICKTRLSGDRWEDGITWDELQLIKNQCGYGELDAVEVYPSDEDIVNVANMRHLWIMQSKIEFAWRLNEPN